MSSSDYRKEVQLSNSTDDIMEDDFRPERVAAAPSFLSMTGCDLAQLFNNNSQSETLLANALYGLHQVLELPLPKGQTRVWWQSWNKNKTHQVIAGMVELCDTPGKRLVTLLEFMAVVYSVRTHYLAQCAQPVPVMRQPVVRAALETCGLLSLRNQCTPQELVQHVYSALMFGIKPPSISTD